MDRMTTEHYGELLRELTAAQADRLRALQELAAFDADQVRAAPRQLEDALEAVDRQFQQAKDELERSHAEACQAIEERYRSDESAAVLEHNRCYGEVDLKYESDVSVAEQKHKDDSWLTQSILDDASESSPKVQWERLQAQLDQSRERLAAQNEEVQTLYRQAVDVAEGRWQRMSPEPQPGPPPPNREAAEQQIVQAVDAVRLGVQRLSRQLVGRLFAGWLVVIPVFLLITGVVAGGLFAGVQPQWLGITKMDRNEWAAITMGIGAATSLVSLLILWQIAAGKTAAVVEPLQQHAVNARAWYQRWLKTADADFRRGEHEYKTRYVAVVERRDRSLAQFAADYAARMDELKMNRQHALAALVQQRDAALRSAGGLFSEQKQAQAAQFQAVLTDLDAQWKQQRSQLTQHHARQQAERDRHRQELWTRCETNWRMALSQTTDTAAELDEESHRQFLEWPQISGAGWSPPEKIPAGILLGEYAVQLPAQAATLLTGQLQAVDVPEFRLPAVLSFPESPSLLVKASGSGRSEAVALLQSAMLRYLTLLPPGDVRFTIIDPVGLGETFASFMHLADYDDLLITNRIWTEPAQIEEQLAKLTEHMENVFQKYLRNEFESIEEYNRHAGEVAEPYRILIVADFPAGFTERAAQKLISIAASGARCGVHTLVSVDLQQPLPRDFDPTRLEAGATILEWQATRNLPGRFVNPKLGPVAALIRDEVPPTGAMAALIRKIGDLSKDVRRVEVPFHRIAPAPDAYWTADSRGGIDVPLGRAGATKLQHLRLGQGTSQHVLIAGKTGSGKSTLLHIIISALALRYSPDEIEFYLIDFKKGVEFKTYASHRLPHARVIAIESDREFGTSVLERLDTVLKQRGDLFRQIGAQDIKSFRDARPDVKMPRILLIVDEFQEFFIEDDKYSQTASLLLDRLVRQGRAFGMHVLLGSQTLGGAYSLARTTVGQMAVRIALQCSETDAHLILSENNGAARLLTRPGEAIYNNANGMMEGNSPFQIAWLDDPQRDDFLDRIDRISQARNLTWPEPMVFEGNLPADPARNMALCRLIEEAKPQASMEPAPRAWLGDSVAMAGPSEVRFHSRSGANLLIIGQDANAALGIMANCIAAVSAQRAGRVDVLTEVSGGVHLGRWADIVSALRDAVRPIAADRVPPVIAEFAAEVARRQQTPGEHPPWFLVIDDLSRYRELRKGDDDFGFGFDKNKTASPGQMFGSILKDGPAVGVHLIIWCDSYNNVDRWFSRQMLREFEMRAVFQMSAADSSNLIDNPAASRLGNNRAILYSDERGAMEKFRPYGPPTDAWLAVLRNLGSSSHGDSSDRHEPKREIPADPSRSRASEVVEILRQVQFSESPPPRPEPSANLEQEIPVAPSQILSAETPIDSEAASLSEPTPDDFEVADDLSAWTVT